MALRWLHSLFVAHALESVPAEEGAAAAHEQHMHGSRHDEDKVCVGEQACSLHGLTHGERVIVHASPTLGALMKFEMTRDLLVVFIAKPAQANTHCCL